MLYPLFNLLWSGGCCWGVAEEEIVIERGYDYWGYDLAAGGWRKGR